MKAFRKYHTLLLKQKYKGRVHQSVPHVIYPLYVIVVEHFLLSSLVQNIYVWIYGLQYFFVLLLLWGVCRKVEVRDEKNSHGGTFPHSLYTDHE